MNRLTIILETDAVDTLFDWNTHYDLFNRRVSRTKTVTVDGGEGNDPETTTTAEKFIYDGQHVAFDFYQPDGGTFALSKRYLYGPAGEPIFALGPDSDAADLEWYAVEFDTDLIANAKDRLDTRADAILLE